MKLPKSVNICGEKYAIKLVSSIPERPGTIGMCDYINHEIYVVSTLGQRDIVSTLLHEINHAIIYESGPYQAISHEMNETLVDLFARQYEKIFDLKFKK